MGKGKTVGSRVAYAAVQTIDLVLAGVIVLLVYPFIVLMQVLEEKAGNR